MLRSRLAPSWIRASGSPLRPGALRFSCSVYALEYHIRLSWSSLERNQPWWSAGVARNAWNATPKAERLTLPGEERVSSAKRNPPVNRPAAVGWKCPGRRRR